MAEIREYPEAFAGMFHDKHHTVGRIVRRRHRVNRDIVECQRGTGLKITHLADLPERASDGTVRSLGHVEWKPEHPVVDAGTADVIAMVVGDDHGIHFADVAAVDEHTPGSPSPRNPGVKKKPGLARFDVNDVSIGAALK